MKKIAFKPIIGVLLVILFSSFDIQSPKFHEPVLITSAGQSADVKLVKLLAMRQSIDAETKLMAGESDLEGIETLVIVPGFSSKGLGAAGISQEDEYNRVEALVEAANRKSIPIVMLHVGGKARRGGQSDSYCQIIAENSKEMIVVNQGNEDGFFTKIAETKGIPITGVEKISEAADPLGRLFN
ncbi:MAG: DUF6305 family protein [Bacteroidales bacterium]|nr:DUF6305 family protein [Bacteroidales bacterium]